MRQLVALGLSRRAVDDRVDAGRLHRIHRGVYAVGHRVLTQHGRYMAAVLACGPRAVLSHRSAAELLGLRRYSGDIDITTPTRAGRSRGRIRVHATRTLLRRDVKVVDGIPCTTVARTLLDLAEVLDRHSLARALEKAEVLRIFDVRAVEDVLARAGGRRGAPRLRRALDEYQDTVVRSILEEWFIALCEEDGLPRPKVNTWLAAHNVEVDFVWPDHGAIVETDSRAYHGTPRLRAKDRRRDERLAKAGWLVKRYPYARVAHAPGEVAREVVDLLR